MLSIGLVLLLSDGKKYLRGKDIKIPVHKTETISTINRRKY